MREHGSRTRYVHGPDERERDRPCRCDMCTLANRAWTNKWEHERGSGKSSFVSVEQAVMVRAYVEELRSSGVGTRTICQASGVSRSALSTMVQGRDRIRHETADRLLAIPPDLEPAGGSLVGAGPTWRYIEALLDRGYTKTWIARQIGTGKAIQLRRTQVTQRNAELVEGVYRRFIQLLPPVRSAQQCCFTLTGEACLWTSDYDWFCVHCGYGLHECGVAA